MVETKNKKCGSVALYNKLAMLLKMNDELGSEAMVVYMRKYCEAIEQCYPQIPLEEAAARVLEKADMRKVWKELRDK